MPHARLVAAEGQSPPKPNPEFALGSAATRHDAARLAIAWALLSGAFLLFRPGYLFPAFGLLDSWVYTGLQWDPFRQIEEFGGTYYASRLSLFLPGALFHAWLPPIAANLCYKLLLSACICAALALSSYRTHGFRGALLAVTLGIVTPQLITTLHSDYMDVGVVSYAMVALACITRARFSLWWYLWVLGAGLAFAAMLIANLSAIAAPGCGIAVYHLVWTRWSWRRQLAAIGIYLVACASALIAGGLVHRALGGSFNFMQPQLDMIFHLGGMERNPWAPQDWKWLAKATWLVLPAMALIWGVLRNFAAVDRSNPRHQVERALTVAMAASLGAALLIEFRGQGVLFHYFYAVFHLAIAVPLLAVLATPEIEERRGVAPLIITAAALLLFATPTAFFERMSSWRGGGVTAPAIQVVLACVVALVALLLRQRIHPQSSRRYLPMGRTTFLLVLLMCSVPMGFSRPEYSDRLPDRYAATHAAFRLINREYPPDAYRFWDNPRQRDGLSLISAKMWGYRLLTLSPFPELRITSHFPGAIIVPCEPGQGADAAQRANEVTQSLGLILKDVRIHAVDGRNGRGFELVSFRLEKVALDPVNLPEGWKSQLLVELSHQASPSYAAQLGVVSERPPAAQPVIDVSGDAPTYERTGKRDHAATAFFEVFVDRLDVERQVAVVLESSVPTGLLCVLQADGYRDLGTFLLREPGRHVFNCSVPPGTCALRVYFVPEVDGRAALPTRIELYELEKI